MKPSWRTRACTLARQLLWWQYDTFVNNHYLLVLQLIKHIYIYIYYTYIYIYIHTYTYALLVTNHVLTHIGYILLFVNRVIHIGTFVDNVIHVGSFCGAARYICSTADYTAQVFNHHAMCLSSGLKASKTDCQ